MTKKFIFAFTALLVFSYAVTAFTTDETIVNGTKDSIAAIIIVDETVPVTNISPADKLSNLYEALNLKALKLNKEAFVQAVNGYKKLNKEGRIKNSLLTIVDFSQPSTSKRMYILDMAAGKLVKQSHVAHGRNTGALMANKFSNVPESFQSSLGFYIASETYQGKHGLSLRLDGVEKNINDNARARAIVIHGADYANESFYKATGYLGRSYGCPAVPTKDANAIISTLCNGSCIFIYSPDKNYIKASKLIA